jgi:hypothetical protein
VNQIAPPPLGHVGWRLIGENAEVSEGQRLAVEIQRVAGEFADYIAGLRPEAWTARAVNHPEIVMGERDEDRTVGMVADHTAQAMPAILSRIEALAAGERPEALTSDQIDRFNAARAAAEPAPNQSATVALIRAGGAHAARVIGALTDEQLNRTGVGPYGTVCARQLTKRIFLGHMRMHLGSIRATVGPSAD